MARIGNTNDLPSVNQVKVATAARMTERIKGFIRQSELEAEAGQGRQALEIRRSEMAARA